MRLHVFSVLDKAVGAYLPPFFVRAKGEAVRTFGDACNNAEHQFYKHGIDYVLVFLGEFDDSSGLFFTAEPARILGALEVRVDENQIFPPEGKQKNLPM